MKKISTLTVLIALAMTANAQIPNSGFENWGTYNGFVNPTGWTGIIGSGNNGYSIQKNSDNYPSGTGSWSILIKTDTLYYFGFAKTDNLSYLAPGFPITGKPKSLRGYYKFLPQNGDTMLISVILWQSGAMVASGTFSNTATISSWTSFNVQISSYTTADSASIYLSSCSFPGGVPDPQGNSALYVDNLSFDTLITTGISEENELSSFAVYPNPTSGQFTVLLPTDNGTITVTDILGMQILETQATQKSMNLQLADNGIYLVYVKTKEGTTTRKVVVNR